MNKLLFGILFKYTSNGNTMHFVTKYIYKYNLPCDFNEFKFSFKMLLFSIVLVNLYSLTNTSFMWFTDKDFKYLFIIF